MHQAAKYEPCYWKTVLLGVCGNDATCNEETPRRDASYSEISIFG
jgi:hypothetical protein